MSRRPFRVGRSRTGLGLFATKPIQKGQFLAYYRGPKITAAESEKREARGNRYLYEINSRWVIDGSPRYNIARYGNHSCRPNAETDVRGHKVLVRAIKNIEPGEEITYHYGKNYFDIYLRPIGCKCLKCIEKRRKERSAKIAETKRRKALEARKAARLEAAAALAGDGADGPAGTAAAAMPSGVAAKAKATTAKAKTAKAKTGSKSKSAAKRKPAAKTAGKSKAKTKSAAKTKAASKTTAASKTKVAAKAKTSAKTRTKTKTRTKASAAKSATIPSRRSKAAKP